MLNWLFKFQLWSIYGFLSRIRSKFNSAGAGPWILSRTACLGIDTFALLDTDLPVYHQQKARIDYLTDTWDKPGRHTAPVSAAKYIIRDDIRFIFYQQYTINLKRKVAPSLLYMDSYSELTDQKFSAINDPLSYFCSNYSDLKPSFSKEYKCEGLLPVENLYAAYSGFFNRLRATYPQMDIVFILFPKKLESRELFRERADKIKEVIYRIATELNAFYVLYVPEDIVDWDHEAPDKYPYHYNKDVYVFLAEKIKELNLFSKYKKI